VSEAAALQTQTTKAPPSNSHTLLVQRKCACGGSSGLTGSCSGCEKKRLLGKPLQTKLRVNEPGDAYEQEADRMADQVMEAPVHSSVSGAPPSIQRLATQTAGQMEAVPASVDQALANPGRPLEPALRNDMEQRFGHDFSKVRVHADQAAEGSAEDIDASAYTVGRDIMFGTGEFRPATPDGRRLIAHELTHVVQQGGTGSYSNNEHTIQRKPVRKGNRAKKRTIIAIHAQPGKKEGAIAYVAGETGGLPITLTKNELSEGSYTVVRRDDPSTTRVEYKHEDGRGGWFLWQRPDKSIEVAERLRIEIQPGTFDFEAYAKAEFEAVPDRIRQRLTKRGAPRLTSPEDQLGFALFAKELQARGVKDEELILFQKRARGGVDPRRRFNWADNWRDAVDEVLGARGKLEKAAAENAENFELFGSTFTGLSKEAYEVYRASQQFPFLAEAVEEKFAKAGTGVAEFENNRELMLNLFDARLRLETNALLDRFEGGLLLTKERLVDSKEGRQQIDLARQAANRNDVKLLKSRSEEADRQRGAANRAWIAAVRELSFPSTDLFQLTTLHYKPSSLDAMKSAEETLAAKKVAAEDARQAYLGALENATGVPVTSWRGFDVDQFFFGASADRSANILARYIARKLSAVQRARKELQKDRRTIYKADMMVALTKERLNVQRGSLVEKLVDDRVEEYKAAPWWEKLLEILSLALIFVPGAAVLRVAASAASVIVTADNESQSELLFDAHVKSGGGSVGSVALSGLGLAGDVGDVVKAVKALGGVGKVLSSAEQAPKVVSETTEAAAAAAKAEPSVAAKAVTAEPVPLPAIAKPAAEPLPTAAAPTSSESAIPAAPETVTRPALETTPLEPEEAFGSLRKELKEGGPAGMGPVVGQSSGRALTGPVSPPGAKRTFSEAEKRAAAAAEKKLTAEREKAALAKLKEEAPDLYARVMASKVTLQSGERLRDLAVKNPDRLKFFYDKWKRFSKQRKRRTTFGAYVKKRLSGDRGTAGELEDAFVRGPNEIMVKAPKPQSNLPGTDAISYDKDIDRIKLLDNKAVQQESTVEKVSALEKNLPKNLGDDIIDIERYVRDLDVPPEIREKVLPRLKSARAELEEYVRKNNLQADDFYTPKVREAFNSILRNNGIDRVVTFGAAGEGARVSAPLAGAGGVKVEKP
jgi:hypothetical protein